jgi:hypothetical protein
VPTPVGPAPRDPNDPDFWDWGDDPGATPYSTNGGHDDSWLAADLRRRWRRRQLISLAVLVVLVVAILAASL